MPAAAPAPAPASVILDQHFYEVRLRAWNCSCPAFTLASFRELPGDGDHPASNPIGVGNDELANSEWVFGDGEGGCTSEGRRRVMRELRGLSESETQEGEPPVAVCKHLLACILGSKCPGLFDGGVEQVAVSTKEAAGWCAGW